MELTWFDIRKQGILTTDPVNPSYLAPVGTLKSSGIEVDASLRFAPNWRIVGNCSWSRARADDSSFATDPVRNVPEPAGTIFVPGRFLDAEERGFSLSAGLNYVGDRPGALHASGQLLPSYGKAKAAVEYAFSPRLSVRIEADNLLDERATRTAPTASSGSFRESRARSAHPFARVADIALKLKRRRSVPSKPQTGCGGEAGRSPEHSEGLPMERKRASQLRSCKEVRPRARINRLSHSGDRQRRPVGEPRLRRKRLA